MNKYYSFLILFLLFSVSLKAQDIPEPMKPARAVNDFAGMLSENERASLEQKLRNFNDTTSSAIVVVTVNSTEGMDVAQYTTELAHKWGVGRAEVDNGLVLLVSKNDRTVNISTGYGLEGAVPDALAKRIIEQEIEPRFREGNFYGGLDAATDTIIKLASGEYTAQDVGGGGEEAPPAAAFILPFLVFLFLVIFPILKIRAFRKHNLGNGRRPMGWLSMILLMSSMNSSRGSSYKDFRGGGGMFGGGGGGGGGFGGFGGGGFGGGGASGSW